MQLNKFTKFEQLKTDLANQFSSIYKQAWQNWLDILLMVILGILAGIASYKGAQMIHPFLLADQAEDIWFGSDLARVLANMVSRTSNNFRTTVHPLFPLFAYPPMAVLAKLGFHPLAATRIVIATVAGLWLGAIFWLLRLIGCQRFDAIIFSLLAATSAAAVFWFVVPETYSFGSLSMLLGLCFAVVAQQQKFSSLWYIAVSAMTLSITTTNWMVGIVVTFFNNSRKRAVLITVYALCLVGLLWGVQKLFFPSAQFFIAQKEEANYILPATSGGPIRIFQALISHTIVMPAIKIDKIPGGHDWLVMFTQMSRPGSATIWGTVAVILWTALLGLGLWGFFSTKQHFKFRIVLGLTLLGQVALHLVYGDETFLYSLHFVIFFIVLVAFSTLTRARPLALLLATMLVLSAGVNNGSEFERAKSFVESVAPAKYELPLSIQPEIKK